MVNVESHSLGPRGSVALTRCHWFTPPSYMTRKGSEVRVLYGPLVWPRYLARIPSSRAVVVKPREPSREPSSRPVPHGVGLSDDESRYSAIGPTEQARRPTVPGLARNAGEELGEHGYLPEDEPGLV